MINAEQRRNECKMENGEAPKAEGGLQSGGLRQAAGCCR